MFSDIREDGRPYESSSNSYLTDESATHHENFFKALIHLTISNISNNDGHDLDSSNVAKNRKVLDVMSAVNFVHPLVAYMGCLHVGLCSYR